MNINIVIKLLYEKVRRGAERVWKVDKNFPNPSLGWTSDCSTWGSDEGWRREDGAHTVQAQTALVDPGQGLWAREHQGPVTELSPLPGPPRVESDPVLGPHHLGDLGGQGGAVQGGGEAGLEDGLLGSGHDLELGKVPLTWNREFISWHSRRNVNETIVVTLL